MAHVQAMIFDWPWPTTSRSVIGRRLAAASRQADTRTILQIMNHALPTPPPSYPCDLACSRLLLRPPPGRGILPCLSLLWTFCCAHGVAYSDLSHRLSAPSTAQLPEREASSSVVAGPVSSSIVWPRDTNQTRGPLVGEGAGTSLLNLEALQTVHGWASCARHAPKSMTLRVGEGGKQIWGSPADRRPPTPSRGSYGPSGALGAGLWATDWGVREPLPQAGRLTAGGALPRLGHNRATTSTPAQRRPWKGSAELHGVCLHDPSLHPPRRPPAAQAQRPLATVSSSPFLLRLIVAWPEREAPCFPLLHLFRLISSRRPSRPSPLRLHHGCALPLQPTHGLRLM